MFTGKFILILNGLIFYWFASGVFINAGDGNVHIWKDYTSRGKQKLVTAFSSIHGHRPGARSVSAVVDWQQQSGYMVCLKSI